MYICSFLFLHSSFSSFPCANLAGFLFYTSQIQNSSSFLNIDLPFEEMTKKVVLKLEFYDDKVKQKAMQTVSGVSGVESICIDMKEKKLTVCGDMDPVKVASRLRKVCPTDMIFVGPVPKEPEKDFFKDKKGDQLPRQLMLPPPLLPPPTLLPPQLKKEEPKKDSSNLKEAEQPKKRSSVAGGGGGGEGHGGGGGGGGDDKKKEIKMKEPSLGLAPISVSAAPPSAAAVPTRPAAPVQAAPAGPQQNGQLVKAFANVPPSYQQQQQPPYQQQPTYQQQQPYPYPYPYPPPPPHHYQPYHQCMHPPPPAAYYIRSVEDNPNSCVIC